VPLSQFDLLAASLRADTADLKAFVEALAVKLSESFPHRVRVERKGGLFGGKAAVRKLTLALGDDQFELENSEGHVSCRRRNVVRGIALKNEPLSLEQWIDVVAERLVQEAGTTESDRVALERMLSG
jgi:hypothetical protein